MVFQKGRRRLSTAEVKWPATILTAEPLSLGETKSISRIGASIFCQELPPIGHEFRLEIKPPNRHPIVVSAKPVWGMHTPFLEDSRRFIVGVEFEHISEDDIQFLGNLVAKGLREKNVNNP